MIIRIWAARKSTNSLLLQLNIMFFAYSSDKTSETPLFQFINNIVIVSILFNKVKIQNHINVHSSASYDFINWMLDINIIATLTSIITHTRLFFWQIFYVQFKIIIFIFQNSCYCVYNVAILPFKGKQMTTRLCFVVNPWLRWSRSQDP